MSPLTYLLDVHKVFIDEIDKIGRGKAYDFYGIDRKKGVAIVVRPDQCE
jgi:hypothetical protein